ncbi:MAG TPA: shikimate dehydrogenase [Nitrospira sp.]|nr:shikimate dehydrogenase [Nitrospira sp.]
MNITASTQFCGVIGNPVEHSLSPAIHNAAFQTLGLDFVYLAWKVEAIEDAVKGLRALGNFRGASVTIPHKVAALPLLDEVDATARHIGAINTIVAENGRLCGTNTDATGALRALKEGSAALRDEAVILGSGGAARAIAFALAAEAGLRRIHLLGIDDQERRTLASDVMQKTGLKVADAFLDEQALKTALAEARVLIHCTPIGMSPKTGMSCVPPNLLHPGLTVMDIVYNPRETQLLADAKVAGCRTISGLEMFLHQAAAQFELWTANPAPRQAMRAVLESRLG